IVRLPNDSLLQKFHLPLGWLQLVVEETGVKIWKFIKSMGAQYVAGGSAANTICDASIFGMPAGFIGKVGDDELGSLFKSDMERNGVNPLLLLGRQSSGRCIDFITGANAERTFATYLGAALELVPEDLKPKHFEGYDYFHIEGYL
ncbi:MAG: PfkB family carbohydrate kinase, partial [Bacteroidales bacterium]